LQRGRLDQYYNAGIQAIPALLHFLCIKNIQEGVRAKKRSFAPAGVKQRAREMFKIKKDQRNVFIEIGNETVSSTVSAGLRDVPLVITRLQRLLFQALKGLVSNAVL